MGYLRSISFLQGKGNRGSTWNIGGKKYEDFPENPISKDEIKLVIYDDCTYNTLAKNRRSGKTIDIEKQFNGSMKWPCVHRNDTILIGKLPKGTYNVNYTLIVTSQPTPQNISLTFTFELKF